MRLSRVIGVPDALGPFGERFGAELFLESVTWTAPYDMLVRIHAIGGGGSGNSSSSAYYPYGGGGGGYVRKVQRVSEGDELQLVVGAAGIMNIGASGNSRGVDGGDTTVSGGTDIPALSLFAGGGGGVKTSSAHGIGGTASGGDVNRDGETSITNYVGGACRVFSDTSGPDLMARTNNIRWATEHEGIDLRRFLSVFRRLMAPLEDLSQMSITQRTALVTPFVGAKDRLTTPYIGGGGMYQGNQSDGGSGAVIIERLREGEV